MEVEVRVRRFFRGDEEVVFVVSEDVDVFFFSFFFSTNIV